MFSTKISGVSHNKHILNVPLFSKPHFSLKLILIEYQHSDISCQRVASASKDGTIKIWDTVRHSCLISLSGHTNAVRCIKWGGEGLLYSASADRSIKVWETTMVKLSTHTHFRDYGVGLV